VSHSKIERSTRAALANFGAIVSIADSALSCQAVDIQQQRFVEIDPVTNIGQAVRCGCPTATAACVPGEGELEPPSSLAIGD
jgi:hypothetical protein